jgi:hypothetical protein
MFTTVDDFSAAILDADPEFYEDAAVMEQLRTIAGCAAPVRYEELTSDDVAAGVYLAYMVNGADHDTAAAVSGVLDAAPFVPVPGGTEFQRWALALAAFIDPGNDGETYEWLVEGDVRGATLAGLAEEWGEYVKGGE